MTRSLTFKRNLESLMDAFGITSHSRLAAFLSMPVTSVGSWLRRGSIPRDEGMKALSEYFKIPENEFFNEDFDAEKYKPDLTATLRDGTKINIEIKTAEKIAETKAQYSGNPLLAQLLDTLPELDEDRLRVVLQAASDQLTMQKITAQGEGFRNKSNTIHAVKKKKTG